MSSGVFWTMGTLGLLIFVLVEGCGGYRRLAELRDLTKG